jgi:8-oxo-dGTP pyrophosphatase MutT (NUDIX family)
MSGNFCKDIKNSTTEAAGGAASRVTEAAGGVVKSTDGRLLMIFRRGMWDLPKGHREPDETLKECAAREVCEECGLDPAKLETGNEITRTEHTFISRVTGQPERKQVTWFEMGYTGDTATATPQTEEDITALEWMSPEEAAHRAEASYPTIRQVMEKFNSTQSK